MGSMDAAVFYKTVQVVLLTAFALYISDFRRRQHMALAVHRSWVVLLKCTYLVPLAIYAGCLWNMDQVGWFHDGPGLLLTAAGTWLVVRAKRDLGAHHTWTGYHLTDTRIVTRGVYAFIRHPLYAGIFLFVAGGICISLPRASALAVAAGATTLVYIAVFLVIAARRESHHLTVVHGDAYDQYRRQVHPFLPIRRYRRAA